ncbi:hypothetical protein lerEdw1_016508 [Lerista edwardsae]|nr:hypothetical protein lerEdw1_016508 [Lerista edwardsae]
MAAFSGALHTFCRSVSLILRTKEFEEPRQNPKVFFLFYCLTLWSAPGACVKLDRAKQSSHSTLQLEKRDTKFYQYGLAVCELPFYEICRTNVSRIQCSELGCCYHKETCYKKAVPEYMKTFVALIVIIMVVFVLFVLYKMLLGCGLVYKFEFAEQTRSNKAQIPMKMEKMALKAAKELLPINVDLT